MQRVSSIQRCQEEIPRLGLGGKLNTAGERLIPQWNDHGQTQMHANLRLHSCNAAFKTSRVHHRAVLDSDVGQTQASARGHPNHGRNDTSHFT